MTKNNWRVSESEIKFIKKAIGNKLTGKREKLVNI